VVRSKGVMRWLGFFFDRELSWKTHVERRISQAKSAAGQLSRLTKKWGLKRAQARQAVEACVLSVAFWGSELWWKGQKGLKKKLESLLRACGLMVTGCMRTTQTAAVAIESGLATAGARLDRRQARWAASLSARGLLDVEEERKTQVESRLAGAIDRWRPAGNMIERCWEPAYETIEWEGMDFGGFSSDGDLWTDGSAQEEEGTGYAVVDKMGVTVADGSCGRRATAFDAELAAVWAAVRHTPAEPGETVIVTDSMAAMHRLKDTAPGPGQRVAITVRGAVEALKKAGKRVKLRWTKGHAGNTGNEAADHAAKRARGNEERACTQTYLQDRIQRKFREDNYPGVPNRAFVYGPKARSSRLEREPRAVAAAISQLRTAHCLSGEYLRRIRRRVTSYCSCGERATREHMIKDCRRHRRWRPPEWQNMSINRILGDGKMEENLITFVKESGVGMIPPGEVFEGGNGQERENWMDELNEFMDFFRWVGIGVDADA
jgi:ribonuclease HI